VDQERSPRQLCPGKGLGDHRHTDDQLVVICKGREKAENSSDIVTVYSRFGYAGVNKDP
jgi:hypothetical protein